MNYDAHFDNRRRKSVSERAFDSKKSTLRSAIFLILLTINITAQAHHDTRSGDAYPKGPHEVITPGELCDRPDSRRYNERIPYCNRQVDGSLKWEIIDSYDSELGFRIRQTGRENFKIDHLIPLCMGGSNNIANLWPQHRTVYEITDPLEGLACEKMAAGVLLQSEAINMIREAKHHLDEVPQIVEHLHSL